ncbi:MAG TPA: pilus assembly protein TadG-related protein [Solirubrobacteraceae bacterium]|nr:pilus assembly protein TadG-related protein [Solirubrobacteraceae bacterium]
MGRGLLARLPPGGERGAILVISAVVLVAIIGMAALAIDIGSFYQAQRQTQAAADAGALAGADALAGGSSSGAASSTAAAMALSNDPTASTPAVTVNGSSVTVNVQAHAPSYLGRIIAPNGFTAGSRAVAAAVPAAATPCSTPGAGCDAVFAMDSTCTNSSNGILFTAGGITINGGLISNGSLTDTNGGNHDNGTTVYGNGPGCKATSGSPPPWTSITQSAPQPWPIDYSARFPKCGPTLTIKCTGPSGTPSYCNDLHSSPWNVTSDPGNKIECVVGSGDPSDPGTYTGAVSFLWGGTTSSATYLCGTVNVNSGSNVLNPATAAAPLLFYAAASGTAVTFSGGTNSINGHTFAPNGTILVTAGSNRPEFLEGYDVNLGAGGWSMTGSGPTTSGSGSTSGSASLTQ